MESAVKTILNTGSGITAFSVGATQNLKKVSVWVADGRPLQVTEITCSVRIALHANFEHVTRDAFALAVVLGTDDVLMSRCPTYKILGLDIRRVDRMHTTEI